MKTLNAKLNKRERRAQALLAHYGRCEALARHLGCQDPDGKKISVALLKIEREACRGTEHACSYPEPFVSGVETYNFHKDEDALDRFCGAVSDGVARVFEGELPRGFFVSRDPRGYALKINQAETEKLAAAGIQLAKDWGGYGLLSPEITG